MKLVLLVAAVVIVAAVVVVRVAIRRPGAMRHGEILPAGEMKAKYGLTADKAPRLRLDATTVPEHLRDLIPLAEKWGIGDDIIRDDLEEDTAPEELERFRQALRGRTAAVTAWLDSFGDGPMPDSAAAYMFMLQAADETGMWPD